MLTLDHFLAMLAFAVATCFTPGPNNLMLLSSGLNFGFLRTIPHIIGVAAGFAIMVLAVGLGLSKLLFEQIPGMLQALRIVGCAYLLWLAWTIANTAPNAKGPSLGQPLNAAQAALFQWVNAKGWMMALTATTTFAVAGRERDSVALMAFIFAFVGFASAASWACFGTWLRRMVSNPDTLRSLNVAMAMLLVASLWPIVRDILGMRQ